MTELNCPKCGSHKYNEYLYSCVADKKPMQCYNCDYLPPLPYPEKLTGVIKELEFINQKHTLLAERSSLQNAINILKKQTDKLTTQISDINKQIKENDVSDLTEWLP